MFELLLNVRHERLYIAGIGHKRSLLYVLKGSGDYTELERTVEDKDVDVSTLDFNNGLQNDRK